MARIGITISLSDEKAQRVYDDILKNYPRGTLSNLVTDALLNFGGCADTEEELNDRLNELKNEAEANKRIMESVCKKIQNLKEKKELERLAQEEIPKKQEQKKQEVKDNFYGLAKDWGFSEIDDLYEEFLVSGKAIIAFLKEKKLEVDA